MKPQVIGISGNMGSGKTTLAKALAVDLQATLLSWDEFDDISNGPDDYVEWHKRGQNYHEWDYEALAEVLKCLKSGQSILHPVLGHILNPTKYVVFDAPLGRLHPQTGQVIEVAVHIGLPLDVSLCRWLIRDFKGNERTKAELITELEYYLSQSRPLFFDHELKTSADLIIDGMLTTESQIKEVKTYLNRDKS